jgi:hypothetical protein
VVPTCKTTLDEVKRFLHSAITSVVSVCVKQCLTNRKLSGATPNSTFARAKRVVASERFVDHISVSSQEFGPVLCCTSYHVFVIATTQYHTAEKVSTLYATVAFSNEKFCDALAHPLDFFLLQIGLEFVKRFVNQGAEKVQPSKPIVDAKDSPRAPLPHQDALAVPP